MKKIVFLMSAGIIALSSCKDKAPYINLTACNPVIFDTTYVLSQVPAAEPHNMLIDDFTGPNCPNCPAGHEYLHEIDSTYPGRINIIGLIPGDYGNSAPLDSSKYDFRTLGASQIEQQIFKALWAMPCAGIDRLPLGDPAMGSIYQNVSKTEWSTLVGKNINVTDPINLSVTSTYDPITQKAAITTTITYLQPISIMQSLSIAVVEDSFIDWQEDGFNKIPDFHFDNIFRDLVTCNPVGSPILPSMTAKEAGRVSTRTYLYKIDPAKWNPAHMRVIAFVTDASDGRHVYQSKQTKLAP